MKITTLLLACSFLNAFAQNPTTAYEHISTGLTNNDAITTITTNSEEFNSEQENVTLFTNFEEFISSCGNDEFLTFEDFAGGPVNPSAGVSSCESIISSLGGDCYPAGEIQEDIEFTNSTAAGGGTMIFFDGTTFGIDNPGVGANSFAAFTIVNFTANTPVTNVAFNLHSPLGDGPIDLRIYGENDLLETLSFNATSDALFVGFIAEEPLDRIELENLDGTIVELVTQFYFGSCENLNIEDALFSNLTFYPNPAQGDLHINSQTVIQAIAIYNLLGQKITTHVINSRNPTINIENLTSGAYILEVSARNKKSTYKLIKE